MTTIECALNKRLVFDSLWQTKLPADIYLCDLKSCYDCILHSFSASAMQRASASRTAVENMFTTIRKLNHTIKTSLQESDATFSDED